MLVGYAYPSLEYLFSTDRWGVAPKTAFNATEITIRHLIGMNSGVPDYDTDAYRHLQYSHPSIGFSPLDILDFVHGPLMFRPGGPIPDTRHHHFHEDKNYCSVNFILLGLVLARFQQVPWTKLDQTAILPPALRGRVRFGDQASACGRYTGRLHGYDRGSYAAAAAAGAYDVSDVNCFGGWTAGNVMMSSEAAADWALALYGPSSEVIPRKAVQQMLPGPNESFYGLATFNLTGRYANGTKGRAWGHLGDTYGFTSIISYFPWANSSIAVATNAESYTQSAPMEVMCLAYNRVLDQLHGRATPRQCAYVPGSYYGGGCQCSE